jgi:hypothetical protein
MHRSRRLGGHAPHRSRVDRLGSTRPAARGTRIWRMRGPARHHDIDDSAERHAAAARRTPVARQLRRGRVSREASVRALANLCDCSSAKTASIPSIARPRGRPGTPRGCGGSGYVTGAQARHRSGRRAHSVPGSSDAIAGLPPTARTKPSNRGRARSAHVTNPPLLRRGSLATLPTGRLTSAMRRLEWGCSAVSSRAFRHPRS